MKKVKRSFSIKFKLQAIEKAKETSSNGAARELKVDQKQIRQWLKQKDQLEKLSEESKGLSRKILSGGGKKLSSETLEEQVSDWINVMRSNGNRVTRKMIQAQAEEIFPTVDDATCVNFNASAGWLEKFLQRNGFSNRRVTSVAQKTPDEFIEKITGFVMFTGNTRKKYEIHDADIVAMDETPIYFDMVSKTTIDQVGVKTVTARSTGNEKAHATVVLAAKGDGTKLKPMIIFKQAVREVRALQDINGVHVATSTNGWMNEATTIDWLDKVFGKFGFIKRLLVWDAYRCHISQKTKSHLNNFNTCVSVVPGGCTKYVQAPDLCWNAPFKARVKELYDNWLSCDVGKEYTRGGNLKAPNKRFIVEWISQAWNELSDEMIKKSFKDAGITVNYDGSEDNEIHCMKDGQLCRDALRVLTEHRSLSFDFENQIQLDEEDIEQLEENEIIIYDD